MFDEKDIQLTPLKEIGEFGMIRKIRDAFDQKGENITCSIGDDAAVYDVGQGMSHLISTDFLVEGVHFDLSYVPLKHLGYKCVAVNVSDIVAMNGEPFGITVSIAVSSRFSVEAIEELYAGVKIACEEYGVTLLGGDTSSSRSGLVISVTALGKCLTREVVYRNGAKENDLIVVTGDLGGAYAGLQILEREKTVFQNNPDMQPDLSNYQYVVGRQLRPIARKDVIQKLRDLKIRPSAMIDISDGLASDVRHICTESNVGATLYEEKIPVDHLTQTVAEMFQMHPATFAMNGGEDYELLFTMSMQDYEKIKELPDLHIIGHITDASSGVNLIGREGQVFEVEAQGWNHFSEEK